MGGRSARAEPARYGGATSVKSVVDILGEGIVELVVDEIVL